MPAAVRALTLWQRMFVRARGRPCVALWLCAADDHLSICVLACESRDDGCELRRRLMQIGLSMGKVQSYVHVNVCVCARARSLCSFG